MNNETVRKFRRGCSVLLDAPDGYEWGKESIDGADCSGLVSHGLICAGFKIRATANEIYIRLTSPVTRYTMKHNFNNGMYVLCVLNRVNIVKKIMNKEDNRVCKHIAPFIAPKILANANYAKDIIEATTLEDFFEQYDTYDNLIQFRELKEIPLNLYSGQLYYGGDEQLNLFKDFYNAL